MEIVTHNKIRAGVHILKMVLDTTWEVSASFTRIDVDAQTFKKILAYNSVVP